MKVIALRSVGLSDSDVKRLDEIAQKLQIHSRSETVRRLIDEKFVSMRYEEREKT